MPHPSREEEIREEWTKILNWFLQKRQQELDSLVEEMEKYPVEYPKLEQYLAVIKSGNMDTMYECGFEQGMIKAIEIITQRK